MIARQKIGNIDTGEAFITPGYNLLAQYVIHTVGPVWQDGKHGERELLASCYKNSLRLATDHKCSSIAFPLISAGIFGCPPEIAIATATGAIREYIDEHLAQERCDSYRRRREQEAALYKNRVTDSRSFDEMLDDMTDTFSEALFKLIDAKGMTDPQVYGYK